MTTEKLLQLLEQFDNKLMAAAGQAKEAKDRAQQALELIEHLRQEIVQVKKQTIAAAVTVVTPIVPHETK